MTLPSKSSIIIGTGGHAKSIISLIKRNNDFNIEGLIDLSKDFDKKETILGFPILGNLKKLDELMSNKILSYFLAIGDNKIRKDIFNFLKKKGLNMPNLIDKNSHLDSTCKIGIANIIFYNSYIGPLVKIGNNNILNTSCIIEHDSSVANNCHLAPKSIICGKSYLGDSCFIGANATVINNIKICSNVTIGAGSTVIKSIENEYSKFVGSPARQIEIQK